MQRIYLGIDTSNYTTSVALCNASGQILQAERQILSVKSGERGLRQSEAVFQHVNALPTLIEKFQIENDAICGIGCSTQPRPAEDSYMPVFRVGEGMARSLAAVLNVPLVRVSHQENHIRSAIYGCALRPDDLKFPVLATHFSGGTSEILLVHANESGFDCQAVGQTLDLNAGQLIDRVGVRMGLPFPAGQEMEILANEACDLLDSNVSISSRVEGCDFHFSGMENQAIALLNQGVSKGEVAKAVFHAVAKTLERAVRAVSRNYQVRTVIFAGGVMANGMIKAILTRRMSGSGIRLYFCDPSYASDHAVGTALLTRDQIEKERQR